MTGRVLIIDDDDLFRESLNQNLADAGFATQCLSDGRHALEHLGSTPMPDIILLDWKMPHMTGIEVLRELRQRQVEVPVVFLTVLSDQFYEEAGLIEGAVDFVEKSRGFAILLKRIELILRGNKTNGSAVPSDVVEVGDIRLHRESKRAFWREALVPFTVTEFQMVDCLVCKAGRDVSYRELYDIVHGEGFSAGAGEIGYRTNVRAFIKRIRQKFKDADDAFAHIENYPGFGYRWSISGGAETD